MREEELGNHARIRENLVEAVREPSTNRSKHA
jgi:hypothetical protein